MKKIITYGTFDLFHIGHLKLLERARALGDHLTVVISSDEFNLNSKNKICAVSYEDRAAIVSALKCVDEVVPERSWEQKRADIKNFNIETFVMGDDWAGEFDFLKDSCEVVYLSRTEGISSSQLKAKLAVG